MAAPVLTSPGQAVTSVVAALSSYLTPVAGLPQPTVVALQVSDRTVGLGNSRGLESIGPFSVVELHGGQIDCVVRFQVWGADSGAADTAMTALQGRLLDARADLWDAGFLQLDGVAGALPVTDGNAWSRTADYHALVEYQLAPASNADSLIASIPVDAAQRVGGSLLDERTTVTDDIVRWDQGSAAALLVRGRRSVDELAVAAFLPAPQPTGEVRILRTTDDAAGPPTDHVDLTAFLAAVNDPVTPERNGQVRFGSVAGFVATFDAAGDPLLLGDWDEDGNPDGYVVGRLALNPPIPLPTSRDRLEISLQTSPLDHIGVVYLRAARALG